jgi:hypothetical protein
MVRYTLSMKLRRLALSFSSAAPLSPASASSSGGRSASDAALGACACICSRAARMASRSRAGAAVPAAAPLGASAAGVSAGGASASSAPGLSSPCPSAPRLPSRRCVSSASSTASYIASCRERAPPSGWLPRSPRVRSLPATSAASPARRGGDPSPSRASSLPAASRAGSPSCSRAGPRSRSCGERSRDSDLTMRFSGGLSSEPFSRISSSRSGSTPASMNIAFKAGYSVSSSGL